MSTDIKTDYKQEELLIAHPTPELNARQVRRLTYFRNLLNAADQDSTKALLLMQFLSEHSVSLFNILSTESENFPSSRGFSALGEAFDRSRLTKHGVEAVLSFWGRVKAKLEKTDIPNKQELLDTIEYAKKLIDDEVGARNKRLDAARENVVRHISRQFELSTITYTHDNFHNLLRESIGGRYRYMNDESEEKFRLRQKLTHSYWHRGMARTKGLIDYLIKARTDIHEKNTDIVADNVNALGDFGFNPCERALLILFCDAQTTPIADMITRFREPHKRGDDLIYAISCMIGFPEHEIQAALKKDSILIQSGFLKFDVKGVDVKEEKDRYGNRSNLPNTSEYSQFNNYRVSEEIYDLLCEPDVGAGFVEKFSGKRDIETELTLAADFPHAEREFDTLIAEYEAMFMADDVTAKGRKTRIMWGPAGGGKNTGLRASRKETKVVHPVTGKQIPIVDFFIEDISLLSEDEETKDDAKRSSRRLAKWKVADFLAAKHNAETQKTGEGHYIRLILDECDRDFLNPNVTGSGASSGVKEAMNDFIELEMRTPAVAIGNTTHLNQDHVLRRASPVICIPTAPKRVRQKIIAEQLETAGDFGVSSDAVAMISDMHNQTPAVVKVAAETVTSWVEYKGRRQNTKPDSSEVLAHLEFVLDQIGRAQNHGIRPIPPLLLETETFFPELWNTNPDNIEAFASYIAEEPNRKGSPIMLTGASKTGKTAFIKWFAEQNDFDLIQVGSCFGLSNAIDQSIADRAVILCENDPDTPFSNETAEIYRFAKRHPYPIFMTVPFDSFPGVGASKLNMHFDYMDREQILFACNALLDYEIDPRVQNIHGLTIENIIGLQRQLEIESHSGLVKEQDMSPEYVLRRLFSSMGYKHVDLTKLGHAYIKLDENGQVVANDNGSKNNAASSPWSREM